MKIKNRHRLKTKDIKKILDELKNNFDNVFFTEDIYVDTAEIEGTRFIFVEDVPCFMYVDDKIIFTLTGLNRYKPKNRFVVVDMGAVRFVTNGADVMAPGVVDADQNIMEGDEVWVCDEKHHKPLAIGFAVMSGEEMINEKKGKAVQIVHYVGDKIWDFVAKSL
jgi:PUA domain protein